MHCLSFLFNKYLITFTLVKHVGIAYFFSMHISSDSLKVFGILVKLFHVIRKMASFQVFGYSICSNTTYMVWCIPNIHTAYLLGKFVAKIEICQYKLKFEICRIQSWWSLFLFQTGNTLFWANLVQKPKIVSLAKI